MYRTNNLPLGPNRVIRVMTALSAPLRKTNMMTFSIDTDNDITAHGTPEEAAATSATPFDPFASQKELAELAAAWPAERLVAIWNSVPGVTPVKKFKDRTTAASRIWKSIQDLGEAAKPEAQPREAESRTQGQRWHTVGQGRAHEGQGD
jgi:hypothetical protein